MTITDQTQFRTALLQPDAPTPETLLDGLGRPAGRRFSVYRNNVAVALTEALIDGFPACHILLGDQTYRAMAGQFLRQHPPDSPVMARFGATLPAFLDTAPQLTRMRWIGDLARLEMALRDSYHAADATPLSAEALAAIPPADLGDTRFGLAPALRLVTSDWPVLSIWRRALDPSRPVAARRPEAVLVVRPDFDPTPHLLAAGDGVFVTSLRDGATLGDAAEVAAKATPEHDPTAILTLLMQTRSLTAPKDTT